MRIKYLFSILLMSSTILFGCWFTVANFNHTYIAGVNNYYSHYEEVDNINDAVYYNGMTVAMPISVWIKVDDRIADQENEPVGSKPITRAILQYKVLPNGDWITVGDYDNPDWDLAFDEPVLLFGRNNINIELPDNTEILIRMYLSDGIYETGDIYSDITTHVPDIATIHEGGHYDSGWNAPHVVRLKIKGRRPFR